MIEDIAFGIAHALAVNLDEVTGHALDQVNEAVISGGTPPVDFIPTPSVEHVGEFDIAQMDSVDPAADKLFTVDTPTPAPEEVPGIPATDSAPESLTPEQFEGVTNVASKLDISAEKLAEHVEVEDGITYINNANGEHIAKIVSLDSIKEQGSVSWFKGTAGGEGVTHIISTLGENKPFATVNLLKEVDIDLSGKTIYFEANALDDAHAHVGCDNKPQIENQFISVQYGDGCSVKTPEARFIPPVEPPAPEVPAPAPEPSVPDETCDDCASDRLIEKINEEGILPTLPVEEAVGQPTDLRPGQGRSFATAPEALGLGIDHANCIVDAHNDRTGLISSFTVTDTITGKQLELTPSQFAAEFSDAIDKGEVIYGQNGKLYDAEQYRRFVDHFGHRPDGALPSSASERMYPQNDRLEDTTSADPRERRFTRFINRETGEVSIYDAQGNLVSGRDVRAPERSMGHRPYNQDPYGQPRGPRTTYQPNRGYGYGHPMPRNVPQNTQIIWRSGGRF